MNKYVRNDTLARYIANRKQDIETIFDLQYVIISTAR